MTVPTYLDIGHHITRIDTAMVHEGLAACYLLQADQACAIIETAYPQYSASHSGVVGGAWYRAFTGEVCDPHPCASGPCRGVLVV